MTAHPILNDLQYEKYSLLYFIYTIFYVQMLHSKEYIATHTVESIRNSALRLCENMNGCCNFNINPLVGDVCG